MSGVAVATGNSWIKISTYIETVHIPSRKQNVLIPPQRVANNCFPIVLTFARRRFSFGGFCFLPASAGRS